MAFELDSRLRQDSHLIGRNQHALLMMMNDCRYPWFIVVPQRANVSEWFDLSPEDQIGLHLDCVRLGQCVQNAFACEKINIAALGNIVRQMHVHVVGRTTGDAAWPGPVWGHSPAIGYNDSQRDARRAALFEQPELPFTPI